MSKNKAVEWLLTREQELKSFQEEQTTAMEELAQLEAKRAQAVK